MRYVSTRGAAPDLGFADVLLAGLATDGGLYVPERWPRLAPSTAHTYAERAVEVMLPFVEPDIDELTLTRLCVEAYDSFRHPAVVPLVQIDHASGSGAVPRTDARVQGRRAPGGRADVRHRARPGRRSGSPSSERPAVTPALRRSTGCRLRTRRHRDPLSGWSDQRRTATSDDHGRPAERPHRRRRGHLRRLPGPRQGDVRRRCVP
jgi:hypothetical protein